MDGEHTVSVHDFPTVTLAIIEAGRKRYFEITGNMESVGQADKERIAHAVCLGLGIEHEEAFRMVFGWPDEPEYDK